MINITLKKTVSALPIQETAEEEFFLFRDRLRLHANEIPDFFVYISESAWEEFLIHTMQIYDSIRHEGQGIFLGKYFKDEFGEFAVAISYQEGDGASTHASVEMSEQCLSEISRKCVAENLLMLTWIHTHPNFGAFYSPTDVNCLKTNFFMPFQTGIVVDILRREHKGFKVRDGNVQEFKHYSLYSLERRRLFKPYDDIKRAEPEPQKNLNIKKKDTAGVFVSVSDIILQEVKTIKNELEEAKNLLKKINLPTNSYPEQVFPNREIESLTINLESIKEQINDLKEFFGKVSNSLPEHLENTKTEIESVKTQQENVNDFAKEIKDDVEELKKQSDWLFMFSIIVMAVLFIIILLIILYR
jgi:proteasome lid subunit RPN8/RPN11/archaellum component FlaC